MTRHIKRATPQCLYFTTSYEENGKVERFIKSHSGQDTICSPTLIVLLSGFQTRTPTGCTVRMMTGPRIRRIRFSMHLIMHLCVTALGDIMQAMKELKSKGSIGSSNHEPPDDAETLQRTKRLAVGFKNPMRLHSRSLSAYCIHLVQMTKKQTPQPRHRMALDVKAFVS